jgi:hypothetical protein
MSQTTATRARQDQFRQSDKSELYAGKKVQKCPIAGTDPGWICMAESRDAFVRNRQGARRVKKMMRPG